MSIEQARLSPDQLRSNPITIGRQGRVTGDGTNFDASTELVGQAAQGASLTRRYRLCVWGSKKVTVTVLPTITGTPTARIYSTLADGTTENTAKAATSLTLTNAAMTEASRALDGEKWVILEVVTVAAQSVQFTQADFRCEPL